MTNIELLDEISDSDIAALDVDAVGTMILHLLNSENLQQETAIIERLRIAHLLNYKRDRVVRDLAASERLADALNWLANEGSIKREQIRKTEPELVLDADCRNGLDIVEYRARSRLAVSLLTDTLSSQLREARLLFLGGRYSDVVEAAIDSVENRVRQLSSPPKRKQAGVELMEYAFGKKGPLRIAAKGEDKCRAIVDLFSGAIAVYGQPLSDHRIRPPRDDTIKVLDQVSEALERVLSANFLHRFLDEVEAERGSGAEASEVTRLRVPPNPRIP